MCKCVVGRTKAKQVCKIRQYHIKMTANAEKEYTDQ